MPLISQVRIDLMLTNISLQTKNEGYLAEAVMPIIPVRLEASKYFTFGKERFDAPPALRAERAKYNRVEYALTTDTYSCEEYGLELPIDDRERQNAIEPLNVDVDSTEILTDMVLNDREQRVATVLRTAGNYTLSNTTDLAGLVTAWLPTNGSSDPISDITITGRERVRQNIGRYPNTLVIGATVFSNLKQHPLIIDRIKYNGGGTVPGKVTLAALAELFEVENVHVGLPLRRTSNQGQTDVLADVWGSDALLAYINPRPALKQISLSYMFQSRPRQVFKYRDDTISSDVIRCSEVTDEKMVANGAGYLWKNVLG